MLSKYSPKTDSISRTQLAFCAKDRIVFCLPLLSILLLWFLASPAVAAEGEKIAVTKDLIYAKVADRKLALDIYQPPGLAKSPLIVWVHGGAWRAGSKADMPLKKLVEAGYAVASVDYRLSPEAKFPAQIHDLKAAIRFLRGNQKELKLEAQKVIIAGSSAGGHLAALVGVSNGHPELEGKIGEHLDQSSDVQGIVSFYGMSNLTTILKQSTPYGLTVRVPALDLLLGGQPEAVPELARLASPVFHVSQGDPPLLLIHGDQDPQAPVEQSRELHAAYQKAGLDVRLEVLAGAAHGGERFYAPDQLEMVTKLLQAVAAKQP